MNLLEEIRTRVNPNIDDVEKIDLDIGPVASTAASMYREPKIGVQGKFSVWFLAAIALAEGNVTVDKFTDEKVNDPRLVNLIRKITTKLDPRIGFGARLYLRMKDGREFKEFLAKPKGDPDNPLTFEELATKYRNA
ncbi:MAG: MmgE/PrpD family protein, partial [Deltaproteobacteria bacterium]|nr:MmgE/PrpD family protein [Deltaproteobacteria bacterium]